MKSALCFPLLGALALVTCGALAMACSSTGDTAADPDTTASDLGATPDPDPCTTAKTLCPAQSHCESESGRPACVPDAPVKVGFDVHCDGGPPIPPPVGFFPNDAGKADGSSADAGLCPPGEQRCCTSSGYQCIFAGALCVMADAACEPTPPKNGFSIK